MWQLVRAPARVVGQSSGEDLPLLFVATGYLVTEVDTTN